MSTRFDVLLKSNSSKDIKRKMNKIKNIKFNIQKYNKKLYQQEGIPETLDSIIEIEHNVKDKDSTFKDTKDKVRQIFFEKTKYEDEMLHLGSGSYGDVFSVSYKNISYAVKMIEIEDLVSFLDEVRISILFSNENIGPKVKVVYKIYIKNKHNLGYGFIVMEKLKYTLTNYIKYKNENVNEELIKNLLKKSLNVGFACFDYKGSNIMMNNNNYIRLIDFGEFCCDLPSNIDKHAIIDIQMINISFMLKRNNNKNIFIDDIKNILRNKERFNKIVNLFVQKTSACNIIDKFGRGHFTFTTKMIRTFNHYITLRLMKMFQLNKGYNYFKDKKPKLLNNNFGNRNMQLIQGRNQNENKEIWMVRLIVALNFILSKSIKSNKDLLPNKYLHLIEKKQKIKYTRRNRLVSRKYLKQSRNRKNTRRNRLGSRTKIRKNK